MKKSKELAEIANAGSAVTATKPDFSLIDENLQKSWMKIIYIYLKSSNSKQKMLSITIK